MLSARVEGWTLVLAGHWNRMIFTPAWVGERLFRAQQLETLVPLVPGVPVVFQNADVALRVLPTRLEVAPRRARDDALRAAEALACTALECLAETPVSAVGVNLAFCEDTPSNNLLELFNFRDAAELATQGWTAQQRHIARQLARDGQILNLKLGFDGPAVVFDFNFHFDVESARVARERLRERTVPFREAAFGLLREVYGLEVRGE